MSFILDALKKAESERSRASGPVLVDVRIAPPRRRLPAWAWALGGVLLANLVVLAWLMLRKPVAQEADAASAAPANAAAVAAAAPANATAPPPATSAPSASTPFTQPLASMPTAPAPSPDSSTTRAPGATPAEIANLPTQRDLLAAGVSLPPLLLNLHVYDPSAASRFVMLNGLRLTEGEFTPDGIKVVAITERGVVLDARGQRFLLPAGG